jgi:hypothetical protein
MPEPKTDRSALELADEMCRSVMAIYDLRRTLYWRDYPKWLTRRRSNVDKQRRRLLAIKCSHKARTCDMSAIAAQEVDSPYADWCRRHAEKLRTIAARLRGTG